jgi:hypothetical protein
MWRFALMITVVELALSGVAATLFTLDSPPDPYLTRDDLRDLRMAFFSHDNVRRLRFEALLGYDSNAVLENPRHIVWVSARVDQTVVDFDSRRRREEAWAKRPGQDSTTAIESCRGTDGQGFEVRQKGATGTRCELVRFKGDRMLIVRVSKTEPMQRSPSEEVAACERRARMIQARMLQKLGWSADSAP